MPRLSRARLPTGRAPARRRPPISSFVPSLQKGCLPTTLTPTESQRRWAPDWSPPITDTNSIGERITAAARDNLVVLATGALAPLRERNFRLLWFGQAVSAAGDSLGPVAFAFAALQVGHTASALGLVLAASTTARVVVLPVGGVWADRLPRQLVMLSSDSIRAIGGLTLSAVLLSGQGKLWILIVLAIVDGAAGAFFMPASGALVPQTVTADRLQQANALMGLSRSTTSVAGAAVPR